MTPHTHALALMEAPTPALLRAHLAQDPALHLYALGDLEEPFYSQCTWWGSRPRQGEALHSVTLLFEDGAHGTLMAMARDEREHLAQ